MRFCSVGHLLTFTVLGFLLSTTGCRSTSLAQNADTDKKEVGEFAWKKSTGPSVAQAADLWTNPPKTNEGIRPTAFQENAANGGEQPLPEVYIKDKDDPLPKRVQGPEQVGFRHGHGHGSKLSSSYVPPPLPSAPNEGNPTLLPDYIIRAPDVLLIESQKGLLTQPVRGQHLVRPDGTVGLGIYGPAPVAGRTVAQAREEIARTIFSKMAKEPYKNEKGDLITPPTFKDVFEGVSVDVLAYNSSVYYIITDGAGLGEQVYRFPVTGNETVLDAISNINGLPVVASPKRIWIARRNAGIPGPETMLPVDWKGITQGGVTNTNWQVMPGDRIYVQADPLRRFNNNLSKVLEPIERLFGVTLLGAQTVSTIRNGRTNQNVLP